jgi:hypothetical protein
MESSIRLRVDDREIPMNDFVSRIFTGVIEGLVDALDKIPEKRERIEIVLEK